MMTHSTDCIACAEYQTLDRRSFMLHGFGAAAALIRRQSADLPGWMPRITLADPHVGPHGDTLVCLFLRGGADGLNIVVPHGDDAYYAARPTLGIPRPDSSGANPALDLDGFFGLHPALAPLMPLYRAGTLAAVHATGSPDESRSHFQAMAEMERGVFGGGVYSGWLARHLATLDTGASSALRAVAIGERLPTSLIGTPAATALRSVEEVRLHGPDDERDRLEQAIGDLYGRFDDALSLAAAQTLDTLAVLERVDAAYQPDGRAYPESDLGRALSTVAQLIRLDVGMEVATVDVGGWDTHAAQGAGDGLMASNLADLGEGLAAFYEDLSEHMDSVTVIVMSEFGRRVRENGALGTDHGHGNMMLLLGDNIAGGQVVAEWPGLAPEERVGPGDLSITIDYRDILAEIVIRRLNNPLTAEVFPGYAPAERGITR
jgi:uncharacterized protein (DUF1501 family)